MEINRIKILFGTLGPNIHGGISQVSPYLESQLRSRVMIKTFIFGRRSNSERLFDKIIGRFADLIKLTMSIQGLQPDLVHHNTAFDRKSIIRDVPLVFMLKLSGIPLFMMIHGSHRATFMKRGPIMNLLRSYLLNNINYIGVLSPLEKKEFCDQWPKLKEKIVVVKNIIRPEFFLTAREENDQPKILFVSRLIRKKGLFDLLEAMPHVLKEFPDAKFVILGSGPDSNEFDEAVRTKGLGPKLSRLEHIDNMETRGHYSRSWCLVFPTHYAEGMPMVVAEAMAAGCPVVTTRTRFSISYMEENKNCIYVEKENPVSIAEGIIRLLKDKDLRDDISRNNRKLAEKFTADKAVEEFMEIYKCMNEHSKQA
jgi:glycosyltransferase involved in cell wall biosynthesis